MLQRALTVGGGGGSTKVYDETFTSFSSDTFDIGFEPSGIIILCKYNGNTTQLAWGKNVSNKYYFGTYNPLSVGDSSSGGFMSITSTGFTLNNSYLGYYSDARVIAFE